MWFEAVHAIRYAYSGPVRLGPHTLRLLPRPDGAQRLISAAWDIRPAPAGSARNLDLNGNDVLEIWFSEPTTALSLRFRSRVETFRSNPFDYVPLRPQLPVDYGDRAGILAPYRHPVGPQTDMDAFARQIREESGGRADAFLPLLCRRINGLFAREIREEGPARSPGATWAIRRGACRDLAWFFVDCCRREGFAARFVSGYHEDDSQRFHRDLHAWAEVYVEGGGWRGFDPTTGMAVADRHIPLAAGSTPDEAAPVEGAFGADGVTAAMTYELSLVRVGAAAPTETPA